MATLLTIENLEKSYGQRVIFSGASLTVNEKQKIGVIGRNGAGKTTFFKLLTNLESYEAGKIYVHEITRLGYLSQHDETDLRTPVLEYLVGVSGAEDWRAAKVAGKFDIKGNDLYRPVGELSGGFQMRIKLAAMLLRDPNLFLLDEPTNYLDVHTQILLQKFLNSYNGAFLIISHDREFLKRTCDETLEIENGHMVLYPRPIDEYLEYKEEQLAYALKYNKKMEREEKHLQAFVDRFRYKASKAKQAQSRIKAIARIKKIEVNSPLKTVRIAIPPVPEKKGLALRAQNLVIGYPDRLVAQDINFEIDRGEKVAILGDNGQGKTTLLKTLASTLAPLSGKFKFTPNLEFSYYAQHVPEEMPPKQTVWDYLRKQAPADIWNEEVSRLAGNFLFTVADYDKEIGVLSGGERARLCLAGLLLARRPILILDEPTNHLDFETTESLAVALSEFVGTILFVSHNRSFVNAIATKILEVKDGKVLNYPGTYEEYVYHLEQVVENSNLENPENKKVDIKITTDQDQKKVLKNQARQTKRQLEKIEKELLDLEKDKDKLLKKQAKNPAGFADGDYKKLGEISKKIEELESVWMAETEKLD